MNYAPRAMQLTICADPGENVIPDIPVFLVCGKPPSHDGLHKDIEWPVEWPSTDSPEMNGKEPG
jgi:hypothetical protein